jgi:hypothetical protein
MITRTLLASAAVISFMSTAHAEPFTFVALGDAPYGKPEEVYKPYEALIAEVNKVKPDLVIHIGDTKSGSTPCSDQMLTEQLNFMKTFDAPLIYTPGDNEWTDCHRKAAGEFDPQERLDFIRKNYFGDGSKSLGKSKLTLTSQVAEGYPENARVTHKDVLFLTVHVVGSNNNFEVRDPKAVTEFFARDAANVKWLREGFAAASSAKAVVVAMQADMFEFDWDEFQDETFLRHSGFLNIGNALIEEAEKFGKPVLLVFGDSHVYRNMRPFPTKAPNVQAIEVPGDKQMHAVEITFDAESKGMFSNTLLVNPALKQTQ